MIHPFKAFLMASAILLATTAVAAPQPTAPSSPSGLKAVSSTSSSIQLDWQNNGRADRIEIERKSGPQESFAFLARVGGSADLYFDTGLSEGIVLIYRVRACNKRGNKSACSAYSNESSAAPGPVPTLPPTPTATPIPPPTPTPTPPSPTPTPPVPIVPTPTPTAAACQGIEFYGLCLKILKSFATKAKEQGHPNTATPASEWHGAGLVVDLHRSPIGVYVVDKSTSRVRGYDGWPSDPLAPPAVILGGKGLACNGDDNLGNLTKPGPDTLCLMGYPTATNTGEQWQAINPEVDDQGNVYMPDAQNNRAIVYYQPLSSDKTGGKGDGIADDVYGQKDLFSNLPNRGGAVGADTLRLSAPGAFATHLGSITVDHQGNVYIADSGNHRVAIYPKGVHSGTVFLGQKSSDASSYADCSPPGPTVYALDKLCNPTLARVDESTGELWVTDETPPSSGPGHGPFEARMLVFTPPFTTGMAASRQVKPKLDKPMTPDGTIYYFTSKGFRFNTNAAYPTGKIWNTELYPGWVNRIALLDSDGEFLTVINAHDKYEKGDMAYWATYYPGCGGWDNPPTKIKNPNGTVAIDDAGNLIAFDETWSLVGKFSLPYVMDANNCLPSPITYLGQRNPVGPTNIDGSTGVKVIGSQLVVTDRDRILVWDDYMSKATNADADFAVGQADLHTGGAGALSLASRAEVTTDDLGHMWGLNAHGRPYLFSLPLVKGQIQLASWLSTYWQGRDLDPPISLFNAYGLVFDPFRKVMWYADGNRLLRISDYGNFASGRVHIDAVLGQSDTITTACKPPSQTTFCSARRLKFDRLGNLYVIENDYECHANDRISMIRSADLDTIGPPQASVRFPALPISKVWTRQRLGNDFTWFGGCGQGPNDPYYPSSPITVAFDSQNHMVIGNDGYYAQGHETERAWRQLWWYPNPLTDLNPIASIKLPLGAVGGLDFDDNDNLVVQDHTWNRVWLVNLNDDPELLVPIGQ